MAEKVGLDLNINTGGAGKTLGDIRKEIKDLNKELDNTEVGSKRYAELSGQLAVAKAAVKDLREETMLLDPGDQAKAFVGLAQTIVGGFAAAQGAAALFVGKNEEIEKALLKVQAAVALLQGVQALSDAKRNLELIKYIALQKVNIAQTNLQAAAESKNVIVRNAATAAQWLLNKAMSSNPIGAVIVAITALVSALVIFSKNAGNAKKSQQQLNEDAERYNNILEIQLRRLNANLKARGDFLREEIRLLKAKGASDEIIYQKERELIQTSIDTLNKRLGFIGKLTEEEYIRRRKLYADLEILDIEYQKKLDERALSALKERNKKIRDESLSENKLILDPIIESKNVLEQTAETITGTITPVVVESTKEITLTAVERLEFLTSEFLENYSRQIMSTVSIAEATTGTLTAINDARLATELKSAGNNEAKKLELRKKYAKIQKGIDIGQAVISGGKAILSALETPPFPVGLALAALAAIQTTAQIIKIKNTDVTGGGASVDLGGASGSIGDIQTQTTPRILQPITELNRETGQPNTPVVKAIVTETDISTTQKRINSVEEKAII